MNICEGKFRSYISMKAKTMQAKYAGLSPGNYLEQPVAWIDSMSQGNTPKIFFLITGHFFIMFGQGRAHDHNLDNLDKQQRRQSVWGWGWGNVGASVQKGVLRGQGRKRVVYSKFRAHLFLSASWCCGNSGKDGFWLTYSRHSPSLREAGTGTQGGTWRQGKVLLTGLSPRACLACFLI